MASLETRIAKLESRLRAETVEPEIFGMSRLRAQECAPRIVKAISNGYTPEPPEHFDAAERIGFFNLFEIARKVDAEF